MFGNPHYCYCEVVHQRSVSGPDGGAIPSMALLATPRPRCDRMAATPDSNRLPNTTHTILLDLTSHFDAVRDETSGAVSNASRRLRALAALSGSLTDSLSAEE